MLRRTLPLAVRAIAKPARTTLLVHPSRPAAITPGAQRAQRQLHGPPRTETLTPQRYHQLADDFLDGVQEQLETAGEDVGARFPTFDVEYAAGVLTLRLGEPYGTYVINKQPPNKQIWLSSPQSGPKRYDMDLRTLQWVDHRTGELLTELLGRELSHTLKYPVAF